MQVSQASRSFWGKGKESRPEALNKRNKTHWKIGRENTW